MAGLSLREAIDNFVADVITKVKLGVTKKIGSANEGTLQIGRVQVKRRQHWKLGAKGQAALPFTSGTADQSLNIRSKLQLEQDSKTRITLMSKRLIFNRLKSDACKGIKLCHGFQFERSFLFVFGNGRTNEGVEKQRWKFIVQ